MFRRLGERIHLKRKNFVICFTGIDGSGKTTHAVALVNFLNEMGYRCIYVRCALRPIFSYVFFAITRILGYWKKIRKNAYTNPLEYAPRNVAKKLGALLRLLFFLDFHIRILFKVRLPLIFGKSVVCDRYFYDLLMELRYSNISTKKFEQILSKTVPQPIITFLLDAHEMVISNRRNFLKEEIKLRRQIFLNFKKSYGLFLIDSSMDFLENQKTIRSLTLKRIRKSRNA